MPLRDWQRDIDEREQREIAAKQAACAHHNLSVRRTIGGPTDDHTTDYGRCVDCQKWLARTTWQNGEIEDRSLRAFEVTDLRMSAARAQLRDTQQRLHDPMFGIGGVSR